MKKNNKITEMKIRRLLKSMELNETFDQINVTHNAGTVLLYSTELNHSAFIFLKKGSITFNVEQITKQVNSINTYIINKYITI